MAIPVAFQSFKAAGIYRLIYDKSTVLNEDTNILRLVVGYSDKGPFNTPVYVKSVSEFTSLFGNGSKTQEKRGNWFHRIAKQCLQSYPILALNLKKFSTEKVDCATASITSSQLNNNSLLVPDIYDTTRFWELDANKLNEGSNNYINICATSDVSDSCSIFIRPVPRNKVSAYDVTVSDWYKDESDEIPEYLADSLDSKIADYFAEIYVFSGKFTKKQIEASETLQNYFNTNGESVTVKHHVINAYGDRVDTLDALYEDSSSGAVAHYVGSLIPYFKDKNGSYVDLSILFNQDIDTHHMMMAFNTDLLEQDKPISINLSGMDTAASVYYAFIDDNFTMLCNSYSPVNKIRYTATYHSPLISYETYPDAVYDAPISYMNIIPSSTESGSDVYAVLTYSSVSYIINANDRFIGYREGTATPTGFANVIDILGPLEANKKYGINYPSGTPGYLNAIVFNSKPLIYTDPGDTSTNAPYIVRIDGPLYQEIGTIKPHYIQGYEYKNGKPAGTDMKSKLAWQNFQLSALTEYKGIRTALLNKSEIDYRYIVDTFETYIDSEVKSVLSYLAKEKDSAFLITNFPSVKTFLKCPFNNYTDDNGNFNVQYVVDGYNKKKAHTVKFSLPSEPNGASYCAFYTPLKFSDGYIDDIVPSAGIVSNLFVQKYYTRHPYDIIAGPNYGAITASGLTGPDYNYSKEELNIIEPFGVNCMVYRPSFGTFINANQTAKQLPKSALSSINVRELCIYIQDEIEKVLQSYQWEFNNATVRQKIKDKADLICQAAQNNGGIQDFLNVMDESNNTADIIDNEMAVISTHIEPGRGMGKMVQELTLYRTGQMRSVISG